MSSADEGLRQMVRALLTSGERAAVRDSEDMDDNTKSSHLSRVKNKIRLMSEDSKDLKEHRPELYDQLHEAVCEEAVETRIENLEAEVHTLNKRVEQLESDREGGSDTPT